MKRRPVILIILIVTLPLAALTWAAMRLANNEQVVLQQNYRALMEDRLRDINANVTDVFEDIERSLSDATAIDNYNAANLRQINRREPQLLQLFVLTPKGSLSYPNPADDLNSSERLFLMRAAKMFTGQDLNEAITRKEQGPLYDNTVAALDIATAEIRNQRESAEEGLAMAMPAPSPSRMAEASGEAAASNRSTNGQIIADSNGISGGRGGIGGRSMGRQSKTAADTVSDTLQPGLKEAGQVTSDLFAAQNFDDSEESSGWFVWYWDRGLNLIYWQRRPSGHIVGCSLERARWMADLIGQLPETVNSESDSSYRVSSHNVETRVRLVNSSAAAVYQWGNYEPNPEDQPLCEVPLAIPLASWRLQCFVPLAQLTAGTGQSVYFGLYAALTAVALALLLAAFFFVREYARDMNEAAQQVSFVNQVSHELKTPLTNIRMYAELLENDLSKVEPDDAERPRARLEVILSEGQRLSRLIGNVLTFARQKRKTLQLQPRDEYPGRLIHQIVDRFRPAFGDLKMEIVVDGDDTFSLKIDADFLEQILGNLISNVEKYASAGGLLKIDYDINEGVLVIDVRDNGPGIDLSERDVVFKPFARVSNSISYAAGTGIGLPIAKELAQLHGGDVVLMDGNDGCWFRATMKSQVEPRRPERESM